MESADKSNQYSYNKKLQQRASSLRSAMTKAEVCLWKYVLKAGMMKGYTFNRQRPVLNYIADFMCKELLLIIEVDGNSHQIEGAYGKDLKRQKNLEDIGYKVIRFQNNEVLKDIKNVSRSIEITVEERELALGLLNNGLSGNYHGLPLPPRRGG